MHTCLNPLYMMRISCRVNLVCRHRSSRATGLACGNADGLFSCSSSSISVASSMIGLSGGVAIARWPPSRSPLPPPLLLLLLWLLLLLRAVAETRARRPTTERRVSHGGAPVMPPARHRPPRWPGRPGQDSAAAAVQSFCRTI